MEFIKKLLRYLTEPKGSGVSSGAQNGNWKDTRSLGCALALFSLCISCSFFCFLFVFFFCSSLKVGFLCWCFHMGEDGKSSSWVLKCPWVPSHAEKVAASNLGFCLDSCTFNIPELFLVASFAPHLPHLSFCLVPFSIHPVLVIWICSHLSLRILIRYLCFLFICFSISSCVPLIIFFVSASVYCV